MRAMTVQRLPVSLVSAAVVTLLVALSAATAAAQTTTTVTAAWDRNTDAATAGYMVYYGTSSGNYQWTHDAGNLTTAQLTLARGSVYYLVVRAYNSAAQVGLPSNEVSVNLVDSPAPTAQITATLQNPTTALVTWTTSNATSATINGVTVALNGLQTVPVSVTTTFTLVARNAAGATATHSATVTVTPPPAPTAQITATLQNPTTALVTWTTSNATSATINGVTVALNGSQTVPVSTTTTFTLVARNAAGATATHSATVTVTPVTPVPSPVPGVPTAMAAAVNQRRVTLTWGAPTTGAAPDRYLLDIGTAPGTANLLNGFDVGNLLTVSGEIARGRYYARVRAANTAGVSGYSNEVSFRVGRTLPTPGGFSVQWQGVTAVLSWSPGAAGGSVEDQATAYVLEAGTVPGQSDVAAINLGNVNSFRADVPLGVYYVRVRALNDFGESEPTADVTLAAPGAPAAPSGLTSSGSGSTVTLQWTGVSGATDYILEAGTGPGLANIGALRLGNVTQFSTSAPPGTYYVRVRAANGAGVGAASNEVIVQR